MKKAAKHIIPTLAAVCLILFNSCSHTGNDDYLRAAQEADRPYMNFLYASNASWAGRIGMTLTWWRHKTCINTVTSFYNKYHTCSNCEDFEKNPGEWNFRQTDEPQVGDIIIQHDARTGRAFHAVIIVDIKDGEYIVNHAIRRHYIKNAVLQHKEKLTFYRYTAFQKSTVMIPRS